jgi:malate synthase
MTTLEQIDLVGTTGERFDEILTPEAVAFVVDLDERFATRRAELLAERDTLRTRLRADGTLRFPAATAALRHDPTWRVAPPAPDLTDRRVEITGPPERKMTINALNSGARVWMADFEDANSPTWSNMVTGQINLLDAVRGAIAYTAPDGREYRVTGKPPTIMVRPRGWHLAEHHLRVGGHAVSASLFDFGLYLFHCGRLQIERGSGPYFYLPKLESHHEARLWNDVFVSAQEALGIARGSIRATVLIETIPAAFEMEEILYELREHSAGLNAGRWDYIFSVIKNFGTRPAFVLPDRAQVTMTSPFLRAYTELLVQTCHRRGAHAIGGMAAFIPSADQQVNAVAFDNVRADKVREAAAGFDGSWVAHPGMVPLCRQVFDEQLGDRQHQLDRAREDVVVSTRDLLAVEATPGEITMAGLRGNLGIALRYLRSWLAGNGAVAIDNLMEDTATAEIARAQVWQWLRSGSRTSDGVTITPELVRALLDQEVERLRSTVGPGGEADSAGAGPGTGEGAGADGADADEWPGARRLLSELIFGSRCAEALTLPGYRRTIAPRGMDDGR